MRYIVIMIVVLFFIGCGSGGGDSKEEVQSGVDFSYSPTEIVKDIQVDFLSSVDTTSETVSYIWNFGDTQISNDANPAHTYASGGKYTVSLQVISEDNNKTVSKTITVFDGKFTTAQSTAFQGVVDEAFANKTDKAGLSVAVYKSGFPVWTYAVGKRSEADVMGTDTPSVLYSITKNITSSLIMKLIEDEKLSLDTKLSEVLDSSISSQLDSQKINLNATIEQLLNHTSGIQDYADSSQVYSFIVQYVTSGTWSPVNLLNIIEHNIENVGTHYYSNANYVLLGIVVEEISGKTYEDYLSEIVLTPLNISGILLPRQTKSSNTAEPYDDLASQGGTSGVFGNLLSAQPYFYQGMGSQLWSAGSMIMTASDLAKFGYNYLSTNGSLLNATTRSTLINSVNTTPQEYGYGTSKVSFELHGENKELYGHGGGGAGYITILYYNPDTDLAITILSNGQNSTENEAINSFDGNELYNIVAELLNAY